MELKDWGVVTAILFAWGGLFVLIIDARIDRAIAKFEEDVIDPIRESLRRIELDTVKMSTWLELNKAGLAGAGGAHHNSPFQIDTAWLAEKIEAADFHSDPVMLAEFRRLVEDPELPTDDGVLWSVIENRFGAAALAQEVMRFGAPGEYAPAIWILCIRKAQKIGADALLREIKVLRDA